MKKMIFLLAGFLLCSVAACAPAQPAPNPSQTAMPPSPTQTAAATETTRGAAFITSTELLTQESAPPQFTLRIRGKLPTPCHQLNIQIHAPNLENKILIDVSSFSAAEICAQMIQPYERDLPLGSFPFGHYTVWVNGELVAEFDA